MSKVGHGRAEQRFTMHRRPEELCWWAGAVAAIPRVIPIETRFSEIFRLHWKNLGEPDEGAASRTPSNSKTKPRTV